MCFGVEFLCLVSVGENLLSFAPAMCGAVWVVGLSFDRQLLHFADRSEFGCASDCACFFIVKIVVCFNIR
jgi:hypothetical protein